LAIYWLVAAVLNDVLISTSFCAPRDAPISHPIQCVTIIYKALASGTSGALDDEIVGKKVNFVKKKAGQLCKT